MTKIYIYIALILAGLNGCASPVLPTREISSIPPFNYRNDRDLKIRIHRDVDQVRRPRILYINPVSVSKKAGQSDSFSRELEASLRDYFYRAFVREVYKDTLILKDGGVEWYEAPENRIMILDASITRLKKGNGLLRYLIGFGLGRSDLQLEGRLYDHRTREEIFAFVIRSRHTGNSYQGLNPRSLSGKYCLRMSGQESAIRISGVLREIWRNIERSGMPSPLNLAAWER